MINQKLDKFIDEVRTGKREGSIISDCTTGSLSAYEKEAWRQLRKELESVGITPALFNQHRDLILEKLLKAMEDGDLTKDTGEELPDTIQESTEERLNTTEPIGHYRDLAEELEINPFDSRTESTKGRLSFINRAYRIASKSGTQRAETSLAKSSAIPPIRGPNRIEKLLFKITHGSLMSAVEQGNEDLVRKILQRGADPNAKKKLYGREQTPLSQAAWNGNEAIVKLLLETGEVDVDLKSSDDRTPLFRAACSGHEAAVKLLLDTDKVEIDSRDSDGQTPLLRAALNGHKTVVKLLLQTDKVNVNSKDLRGRTPLSWATWNGHEAIVRLLLEMGKVDIDTNDSGNITPLSWAAREGYVEIVKLLLKTGKVDVNSRDSHNRTPLSLAAGRGHEAVVKLLLKMDEIDVNLKDQNGRTPLWWATKRRHKAIVGLLSHCTI